MANEPLVIYTRHAREQMAERRIAAAQVERTIANPTRRYPSTNPPGRLIAERVTAMGNTLRGVYVERPAAQGVAVHVITVIRIGRQR